jgi:hypothetical protein
MSADLHYSLPIFADLGRNDICPCGSGKKYKKCHAPIHQIEREAAQKTQHVAALVGPDTIPWRLFQVMQQATADNLLVFLWDLLHEQSPLRAKHISQQGFISATDKGEQPLPASRGFELLRYRLDAPDTVLLLSREDLLADTITFQLITLRPNEIGADGAAREVRYPGLRLWELQQVVRPRAEIKDVQKVSPSDLGLSWTPRTFERPVKAAPVDAAPAEQAAP